MSTEATTPAPAVTPMERLLSLRIRVMRAREQSNLLRAEVVPMFHEEMDQIISELTRVWLRVSDIIDTMTPEGANDTEEDILREQRRLAGIMKKLQQGDALKGIVDPDDP